MHITQILLYHIPSLVLCIIIVGASLAASVYGVLFMRRAVGHQKLKTHNDIAGAIFSALAMACTVLMAFVVVVVWQGYDRAAMNVETEANCLMDLRRDSYGLGEGFSRNVYDLTDEYAKAVIEDEWKKMARGLPSERVSEAAKKLFALYTYYTPRTDTDMVFFEESVKKLNQMLELRRARLVDSRSGIHPIMWFVLMAGSASTIVFAFFFGSDNLRSQIIMTSLLSVVIGLILFMILVFDFPFTGDTSVGPDAFKTMLGMSGEGS